MNVTLKELKVQPGRIVSMAGEGTEVVVTVRGVPKAKIIPFKTPVSKDSTNLPGFGMWADREDMADVDAFLGNLRKGRRF